MPYDNHTLCTTFNERWGLDNGGGGTQVCNHHSQHRQNNTRQEDVDPTREMGTAAYRQIQAHDMSQMQCLSQPPPIDTFQFGILGRTQMDTQPHLERENHQHAQIKNTAEDRQHPYLP